MILTAELGDSKTFTIPMRWGNRAFAPVGVDWGLVFTVKADANAEDSDALLQASGPGTGLNLEVSGSNAIITFQRADTYSVVSGVVTQANPGTYRWDIQAIGIPDGAHEGQCRTVASGTLVLSRDITRGSSPVVPVFTTVEPVFQGNTGPQGQQGQQGQSAYDIAMANGFMGTEAEWIASLVGVAHPAFTGPSDPNLNATEFPIIGTLWFCTRNNQTYTWDGSYWVGGIFAALTTIPLTAFLAPGGDPFTYQGAYFTAAS
jgi:hypothetical protein